MRVIGTLPHRLVEVAALRPDSPAYRTRDPGGWTTRTWAEVADEVERLAAGLVARGVGPGDRVALWGENSERWALADLAILSCGAVSVPIYAASTPPQAAFILRETEAAAAFLGPDQARTALADEAGQALPPTVVLLPGRSPEPPPDGLSAMPWERLPALADSEWRRQARSRRDELTPDDLATIIYTSGTGGPPKGAMLDHRALMSVGRSVCAAYGLGPDDVVLSYLPLSHAIERLVSIVMPIVAGGASVAFAEGLDRMPANLLEVRPTGLVGVPRVWEKFVEAIRREIDGSRPPRRLIFGLARVVGGRVASRRARGRRLGPWLGPIHRLISRLVDRRLRRALGLDRARYLLSGGAPLRPDTRGFLEAFGLPVLEDYGQTETIVTTITTADAAREGTVGRPLPGTRIRLAPDEEIEVSGDHVFRGYWRNATETAEAFTPDGWLRTGDLGRIDDDGFLTITGRKKALLITSGGKNVAPEPIEAELSAIPGVSQAVVTGDGRKYLVALLTLDAPAARRLAGSGNAEAESLARDTELLRHIQAGIDRINRDRAPCERIKRFCLLHRHFSAELGELTPLQKIRRGVVERRYAEQIEALYGAPGPVAVPAPA